MTENIKGNAKRNARGRTKFQQRGFDLIQVSLYALLAAGIIAVAFRYYRSNQRAQQVQQTATDLQTVAAKTASLFPAGTDYAAMGAVSAANCALAIQNQAFANSAFLVIAGAAGGGPTVNHPFDSGAVQCGATQLVVANDGFRIQLLALTDQICADLVRSAQGGSRRILVDAVVVQPLNGPLVPATLGAQCSAAAAADNHTVAFDFGRS